MAGTQFIGKEPMIAAYSRIGDDLPWVLFQGKKKRQGGIGVEELEEWLDVFAPAGSTASYTLCVYEEGTDTNRISISSDCLACWDFKLNEYRGGEGAVTGLQKRLEDRIGSMMMERLDKLEEKLDGDKREDEGFDLNKVFMGWLSNPEQLDMVIGAVKKLFSKASGVVAPAAIGALDPVPSGQSETELYERLGRAIERLQLENPGLINQLEKLADIKEKKPDTFKFLISNLNAL